MILAGSKHVNVVLGWFHLFGEQEPEAPQGASKTRKMVVGLCSLDTPVLYDQMAAGSTSSPPYQWEDTGKWKPLCQSFAVPLPFFILVKIPLQTLRRETQKFKARPSPLGKNTTIWNLGYNAFHNFSPYPQITIRFLKTPSTSAFPSAAATGKAGKTNHNSKYLKTSKTNF